MIIFNENSDTSLASTIEKPHTSPLVTAIEPNIPSNLMSSQVRSTSVLSTYRSLLKSQSANSSSLIPLRKQEQTCAVLRRIIDEEKVRKIKTSLSVMKKRRQIVEESRQSKESKGSSLGMTSLTFGTNTSKERWSQIPPQVVKRVAHNYTSKH